MNSLSDVWQNVLDHMAEQLSETTIRTWFDEVSVVTMEDSAFVLHCSNGFKKNTIEARFMRYIKDALLIVILVFKPTGLFGEKSTDKV